MSVPVLAVLGPVMCKMLMVDSEKEKDKCKEYPRMRVIVQFIYGYEEGRGGGGTVKL